MIIGFSGKRRSGKDTAANILIKEFGFKRMSLADSLKEICSDAFEIDLSYFHDDNLKDKPFDRPVKIRHININNIVEELSNRNIGVPSNVKTAMESVGLGKIMSSPRHLLQFVGTDIIRNNVDPNVWIKIFTEKLKNTSANVACADLRFSNERLSLRSIGAKIYLVERPTMVFGDTHVSENDLGDSSEYDKVIINEGTQAEYEDLIRKEFGK